MPTRMCLYMRVSFPLSSGALQNVPTNVHFDPPLAPQSKDSAALLLLSDSPVLLLLRSLRSVLVLLLLSDLLLRRSDV